MTAAFERARGSERLPLVHVKTIKGHGWTPADRHPFRQHFSFPFDPVTGELADPGTAVEGYQDVAAAVVGEEMELDESIVCLTASTLYATGLAPVFQRFPARCFDPGMEEQHALALTTGFALAGMKPVIAYQSTFLQRAFDQLIHDVCFADLPTLILAVRSGFSGYDNPTHHGIYDFAYLRGLPNLRMLYPKDRHEAQRMVRTELRELSGPTLICMPYGPVDDFDDSVLQETDEAFAEPQLDYDGRELMLLTVGNKYAAALEVVEDLRDEGLDAGLINLRYLKPLPEEFLAAHLVGVKRLVTLEEGVLDGGVGSAIAALCADHGLKPDLLRLGLPCKFVEPGSNAELCRAYGLDARGIHTSLARRWPRLLRRAAA
jgi:1-deoxy-D-xylulose-5-phosphate synthase